MVEVSGPVLRGFVQFEKGVLIRGVNPGQTPCAALSLCGVEEATTCLHSCDFSHPTLSGSLTPLDPEQLSTPKAETLSNLKHQTLRPLALNTSSPAHRVLAQALFLCRTFCRGLSGLPWTREATRLRSLGFRWDLQGGLALKCNFVVVAPGFRARGFALLRSVKLLGNVWGALCLLSWNLYRSVQGSSPGVRSFDERESDLNQCHSNHNPIIVLA